MDPHLVKYFMPVLSLNNHVLKLATVGPFILQISSRRLLVSKFGFSIFRNIVRQKTDIVHRGIKAPQVG